MSPRTTPAREGLELRYAKLESNSLNSMHANPATKLEQEGLELRHAKHETNSLPTVLPIIWEQRLRGIQGIKDLLRSNMQKLPIEAPSTQQSHLSR